MKKYLGLAMPLLLLILFSVGAAAQTTIMLGENNVTDDTYVDESQSTTNFGSSQAFYVEDYSGTDDYRAYMIIDVTSLPEGITALQVVSATYNGYVYANDGNQNLEVFVHNVYDVFWDLTSDPESNMDWSNQVCGTNFDDSADCDLTAMDNQTWKPASWVQMDVTEAVRHAVSQGNNNVSLAFKSAETVQSKYASIASKEHSGPRHFINVTYDLSIVSDGVTINDSTYNVSSSDPDCIEWRTSTTTSCTSSDTTPTVKFETDKAAWCAISGEDKNFTDINAIGGDSRNCTGGQGTTSHSCTLTAQDELTAEISNIYIGCQNFNGEQNVSSTSGPLKMSVFSSALEAVQEAALDNAIARALAGEVYTSYSDQKLYGRDSSNNQFVLLFDRVVKWMNKIWAFNVLTGNESRASDIFNISPAMYVREFNGTNPKAINDSAYQLIQDTK